MGRRLLTAPRSAAPLPALVLLLLAAAVFPIGSVQSESPTNLRPQSDLTSNCFDFPATNFDRVRSIENVHGESPKILLQEGENAIDFTLHDTKGQRWNLLEALEGGGGKPVVLIWGMYTCPAFQGMGTSYPWEKCSYRDQYNLVESYKDRATFVHLYGAEPHPVTPGTNFDSGRVHPSYFSTVPQALTHEDRLDMVALVQHLMHPDQVILPDYLPGNPYSDLVQPVWCSYVLGARPATIVSPDGTIVLQQEWLQTVDLGDAIDEFWRKSEEMEGRHTGKGVGSVRSH